MSCRNNVQHAPKFCMILAEQGHQCCRSVAVLREVARTEAHAGIPEQRQSPFRAAIAADPSACILVLRLKNKAMQSDMGLGR